MRVNIVRISKQLRLFRLSLFDVVFFIICLFLVIYIASAFTNMGVRFYIVHSSSMKPVTIAGDVVVVTRLSDERSIKMGDVIVFKDPKARKQILIHRVIDITSNGFVTKGDANESPDPEIVSLDNIIGFYRFKIPFLGLFFEGLKIVLDRFFVKSAIGWVIVGIGIISIIGYRIGNGFSYKNKSGEENP